MEKRYNFSQVEKQMQDFWDKEQLYRFDKNEGDPLYAIDTPPPTVSGQLHMGHLFSYTQAEIIARFRRMQGYHVFYPFGFDDNGLPTERLVEREEEIRASELPRSVFTAKCQNIIAKYTDAFQAFWRSLGFSADWSLAYHTASPEVQKISQTLFLELVEKNKAYTKEAPVLWCTECQTSIAQAELDTAEVASAFHTLSFLVDGTPLAVATTRPELLYGCCCLFVNPEDERYKPLIGKEAVVPLYGFTIPIKSDTMAAIDKGTGVVMCATFGDSTDVEWYNTHNLPYRKVILPTGNIAEEVPFIGGLNVLAARKEIIRLLTERNLLTQSETITHSVGIHERCGKPIEIIPSRQWYIDVLSQRQQLLQAADEINWYPSSMKSRYTAWVENLKWDWCISRQRYFGVPFPVWYCKNCGKTVFAKKEQLPVNPLESNYEGVCECGCTDFIAESAVLDTWATSSITPQIHEQTGCKQMPMQMRTHAHEIIRTWTFYTIVRSLYHSNCIPWKDLMICGFILSKKGEKISKSKGNGPLDPQQLIAAHSADVLRYWTAGARLGTDTFFSPDDLTVSKRLITKLWNACKFSLSHLQDMESGVIPQLLPVDRWILERAKQTTAGAARLLYEYEIGTARHEVDELFWKDFCDNYIEIVKERLYRADIHGAAERRSGQYALYHALLSILKLYSIYVPHITEYLYQGFFRFHEKEISIHLTQWEKPAVVDSELIGFGEDLKDVIYKMRKYKSENNLSMNAEMDMLEVHTKPQFSKWFRQTEMDLLACSRARKIVFML